MDRFLVHGHQYKALRDAVGTAVLECSPQAMVTALEVGRAPAFPLDKVAPLATCIFPLLCQMTQWEGSQGVTPCIRSHVPWPPQAHPAEPAEQQLSGWADWLGLADLLRPSASAGPF